MFGRLQHEKMGAASSTLVELAKRLEIQKMVLFFAFFIIVILIILAFFGDLIVLHSPIRGDLRASLQSPFWLKGGTMTYPLGTDSVGRCILSRIMSGAKYSLGVSAVSIIISALIGVTLGLVSGFLVGLVDTVIMRIVDLAVAFPMIILGLILALTRGASISTLIIALVIVQWARFARQVRGEALSLRETEFVAQARVAGCSGARIIWRHLFPNITSTVLVLMTLQVGWSIIAMSSLSFLGAGIPSPKPGWGLMVAEGREYIATAWWISLMPATAILLTVLSFNIVGDWIRDRLDPRLRQL